MSKNEMKKIESPDVAKTLILICEKCGKKLATGESENPSREIQKALKKECNDRYGKKEVRPVVTSCLDICPDGTITIAVVSTSKEGDAPKFFEVGLSDLKTNVENILDKIKK